MINTCNKHTRSIYIYLKLQKQWITVNWIPEYYFLFVLNYLFLLINFLISVQALLKIFCWENIFSLPWNLYNASIFSVIFPLFEETSAKPSCNSYYIYRTYKVQIMPGDDLIKKTYILMVTTYIAQIRFRKYHILRRPCLL